jgi:hypothetical protein
MGLGPPVCLHCRVVGELTDKAVNGSGWRCPICHDRNLAGYYFEFDTIAKKELDDNEKFWRFTQGKDPCQIK